MTSGPLALALALTPAAALTISATPAAAQTRDLCPDRPGLGTPPCTVEPGRVVIEVGLADWSMDRSAGSRSDTILTGDTLVRVGVTDTIEVQVGWTALGFSRERTGAGPGAVIDTAARTGDMLLGAKLNLVRPDGGGFSAALLPSVSLPTGRAPIGAGDWGAGLIAPISYDLSDAVQLQASPEIDAAVDGDGKGRHLAWGGTLGLGFGLTGNLTGEVEVQAIRDRDPAGATTRALAGLSLGWQPSKNLQLDAGANLGLNRDSGDFELYMGVSRRF